MNHRDYKRFALYRAAALLEVDPLTEGAQDALCALLGLPEATKLPRAELEAYHRANEEVAASLRARTATLPALLEEQKDRRRARDKQRAARFRREP